MAEAQAVGRDLYPIPSKPGVKRDGTEFEGDYYSDAQWTRWQRALPRKIGGYRKMSNDLRQIVRGANIATNNGMGYCHAGTATTLKRFLFNMEGTGVTFIDRTPTSFASNQGNNANVWQFAVMYDAGSTAASIIAHAAPNLINIDATAANPVFVGDAYGVAPLSIVAASSVSGGVAVLHPYLFNFGSAGYIGWTVPNQPTDFTGAGSGSARVTSGKIVRGIPTRAGGGQAPGGLFWATDSLVRCTFVGGTPIFNFDTLTEGYSIMSPSGVVEYNGIYYWPGINRFLMYNGVIREVPNQMNFNFFFDSMNAAPQNRCKVEAQAVPFYGEIWIKFCRIIDGVVPVENNWAIIYNIREETWYDTPLERSCGYTSNVFPSPVMFDNQADSSGSYIMWQHEYGVDREEDGNLIAINSYFESSNISLPELGINKDIYFDNFEPDFVMSGGMTLEVSGRKYAQSQKTISSKLYNFDGSTEYIPVREQFRNMQIKITSNVAGGDFQMGIPLLSMKPGDMRP